MKILPLICYEIIYSGKIFTNNNFDYIVNISEDGWFGKSIGPEQHLTHSIFRAIESGKYVLRSANNGTSAIINPLGVIEQKIDINKSGYIDLGEIRKIEPTLFAKFGNKIFGFIILLYIFLIFSFKKLRKMNKKNSTTASFTNQMLPSLFESSPLISFNIFALSNISLDGCTRYLHLSLFT